MPENKKGLTVVLGASSKEERYSNKALKLLLEKDFRAIPVTPAGGAIHGIPVVKNLSEIKEKVKTLTLYVNPNRSAALADEIVKLAPERIIFNPGTESSELKDLCVLHGIEVMEACTLVLLKTGQF